MEKANEINMLLEAKVAIVERFSERVTDVLTVQDVVNGSDFGIYSRNNSYFLIDFQDESDRTFLGNTVQTALLKLDKYTDYFNGEDWYSNFSLLN